MIEYLSYRCRFAVFLDKYYIYTCLLRGVHCIRARHARAGKVGYYDAYAFVRFIVGRSAVCACIRFPVRRAAQSSRGAQYNKHNHKHERNCRGTRRHSVAASAPLRPFLDRCIAVPCTAFSNPPSAALAVRRALLYRASAFCACDAHLLGFLSILSFAALCARSYQCSQPRTYTVPLPAPLTLSVFCVILIMHRR